MKPYPKTKPSGVEWLGDVPEHWEVKAIKWTTPVFRGASPRPIDDPVYFDDDGEFAWVRIADVTASNDYLETTTQKLSKLGSSLSVKLHPGSLFLSIAGTVGKPCITKIKCCIHDGFVHFPGFKGNVKFLFYLFASGEPYKGLGKLGTQLNLNTDTVGSIVVGFPPPAEQTTIAGYLDRETGRMDELVGKKRELIERLKEKRTALISRTVTRGLPADLPPETLAQLEAIAGEKLPDGSTLKPSGHPWVKDIPEHWTLERLKYVSTLFGRIGFRGYSTEDLVLEGEGAISMSPSNMVDGEMHFGKCTWLSWQKYHESPEIKIEENDVVMVKTGSTLGKVAFVRSVPHPMTINPQLMIFKKVKCSRRFLFYFATSTVVQDVIPLHNTGSTIPTMTQEGIGKLPIPMPPLPEQRAIAAYLDEETAKLDALIAKVETAIERLQEYRTALITAAVTGKIDVREEVEA